MTPPYRRRWSDGRRINLLDADDRVYWSKFFGVEEGDLFVAVDQVGTRAEDVRQFLNRRLTHHWVVDSGREERRRGAPSRRSFQ